MIRKQMARQREPMKRGKGIERSTFAKTPAAEIWRLLDAAKKPRARLRARRRDPETLAADERYRETVADICRRIGGARVCENSLCPGGCGPPFDTNHVVKRGHYGRKTRAARDDVSNLMRMGRRCHEWTDAPADSIQGRLVITARGGEIFTATIERAGRTAILGTVRPITYKRPRAAAQEETLCPPAPATTR